MSEEVITTSNPVSTDAGTRADASASSETKPQREEGASRPLPDDALIIVPVRNVVLFPGMVFPLTVGRERSRAAAYEAAGSEPFRPVAGREVSMSYWRVPIEVLEDAGELATWALAAIRAAGNAAQKAKRKTKRKPKPTRRKAVARKKR